MTQPFPVAHLEVVYYVLSQVARLVFQTEHSESQDFLTYLPYNKSFLENQLKQQENNTYLHLEYT